LNYRVNSLLGLRRNEVILIDDFLHTKLPTLQGKVTKDAIRPPSHKEIEAYLRVFRRELDDFLDDGENFHNVVAVRGKDSAMVEVDMVKANRRKPEPQITDADSQTGRALARAGERLLRDHGDSQWLYFKRGLKLYDGTRSYVFKPMKYSHWTRTQALLDAGELIAETLVGTGE
jgi:hypothetical protein